jgi:hypothetical protein
VLLDDVELLLDDLVGDIERAAAAVSASVGAQLVRLDLEMRRQRLAPRGPAWRRRLLLSRGKRRRHRPVGERSLRLGLDEGRRCRKGWRRGGPLLPTSHRQQPVDAVGELRDLRRQLGVRREQLRHLRRARSGHLCELRAELGVLAL